MVGASDSILTRLEDQKRLLKEPKRSVSNIFLYSVLSWISRSKNGRIYQAGDVLEDAQSLPILKLRLPLALLHLSSLAQTPLCCTVPH